MLVPSARSHPTESKMPMSRIRQTVLAAAAAQLILLVCTPVSAQSLRGSPSSVDRMYNRAVNNGIYFYKTDDGVRRAADEGRFLRLSGNANYKVHDVSFPYVRPATYTFVTRLAAQYRRACGEKLVVTSATRPKTSQPWNSHARSVHPTGMAIDLRKPAGQCRTWLRETLLSLERAGLLEATEEYRPPHFHVAVFARPYEQYVKRRGGTVATAKATSDTYRVRKGDSLWGIARRNATSVASLKRVNDLESSKIIVGQVLMIPSAR